MPRKKPLSREEQNAMRRAFYEQLEQGDMSIPQAMKAMRKMTGLTQEEFAAHRGLSRRVVQDVERGVGNPTVESLNEIGKLFGLRVGFVRVRKNETVG